MTTMMHTTRLCRRAAALVASVLAFCTTIACGAVVDSSDAESETTGEFGLPADVAEKGAINVATGQTTVPTHFLDDNGDLVGFNVDITEALESRLGVELKLTQVPFDSVLAGIQAGRYDTALYNVSDNAERREVVDFLDYAVSGSVIVTPLGNPDDLTTEPASLCGRKIGVVAGGYEFQMLKDEVSPECVASDSEPVDLRTFESDSTVRQALLSGRVDALVDGLTATPYMVSKNTDKFELIGKMPIGADPLGMPFKKGRHDLVEAFQRAWVDILESGEYTRLAKKWELKALVPEGGDFFEVNSGKGFDE